MADPHAKASTAGATTVAGRAPPSNRRPLSEIYAQPIPIKTFPLPNFYPGNPISLIHLAYQWARHALWPPRESFVVHQGMWSPDTRSVHIRDATSIRALWEQGFFGKGNLSRSEPEWFRREQQRRGLQGGAVSHLRIDDRRVERRQMKWERARGEQEVIWRQQSLEAEQTAVASHPAPPWTPADGGYATMPNPATAQARTAPPAPVGPLELLTLPNSDIDLPRERLINGINDHAAHEPNGSAMLQSEPPSSHAMTAKTANGTLNGIVKNRDRSATGSSEASDEPAPLKRQKSVRFSPKVESTTFLLSDPPSPRHALISAKEPNGHTGEPHLSSETKTKEAANHTDTAAATTVATPLVDKEHLQLQLEEAFFLAFGLGVLEVVDPLTGSPLSTATLFDLCRRYSYFPPRGEPSTDLTPDDPFLIQYAVYHHFRSLGWAPRAGIKFGVDWLLYLRGPVFDHAEFAVIAIPSYSDPIWQEMDKRTRSRSWYEIHATMRVISHAMKSLVLAHVEVPPPAVFREALDDGGAAAVLGMYKVQEVMMRRWSSKRNR